MGIKTITIATTASVNDDALSGDSLARKPFGRRISSLGLAGSAQPGDYGVKITVEGVEAGEYYNLAAGANTMPDRETTYGVNIPVPANFLVEALVLAAPTTNAGKMILETKP